GVISQYQLHAVGVTAVNRIPLDETVATEGGSVGKVLDGLGVLHVDRPLGHGDRVGSPFEEAGVEVPELAAPTIGVGRVPGPPEAGAEPLVPVEHERVRLGSFGGPPAMASGVDGTESDGG